MSNIKMSTKFESDLPQVQNDTNLEKEMRGKLPYKLYNITLTGRDLKNIHAEILRVSVLIFSQLVLIKWDLTNMH